MWFNSKKGILEHCGKNEKDVRWLDRAINSGKVIEMGWEYCTSSDYIKELEDSESDSINTIVSLKKRISELEWREWGKGEKKSDSEWNGDTTLVEELKEHLRYAWERRDVAYKSMMFVVGAYTKWDPTKEVEMLKKIWYTKDVNEEDEIRWAKEMDKL